MRSTKMSHAIRFTRASCVDLLVGLGSPVSLAAAELVRKGDDTALLELEAPFMGDDWRAFFRDYQAVELLSKFDGLNLSVNREAVAVDKFLASEKTCFEANIRFAKRYSVPFPGADVSTVFHRARKKIARVLGDFSWDEAGRYMAFGPGATLGLTRKRRHAVYKFGFENPTVTGECATFAKLLIGSSPQWSKTVSVISEKPEGGLSIVRGSRITTVPKNAKTDRVIAIEPMMNMYVQKGIGGVIRRKLRTVGIDLNSQARNQDMARKGSLDNSLATVDLKSASDSIARELVDWLLPEDWVTAMKVCRAKSSVLPSGEEIFLQKFSSMGNGFTFELQSLIFWGLLSACTDLVGESSRYNCVYGDDIVCPVSVVPVLFDCLSFAGFTPNEKKSFWDGPFRESCGKHFYLGNDVTPLYVKKHVGSTERKLWFANSIKRLAHRLVGLGYGCCSSIEHVYGRFVRTIDRRYTRLSIPDGFGDGGLVRDFDEARPNRPAGRHSQWDGWTYNHLRRDFVSFVPSEQPALTTALAVMPVRPVWESNSHKPHDRIHSVEEYVARQTESVPLVIQTDRYSYRIVKSVAPRWCNLGPWVVGFSITIR